VFSSFRAFVILFIGTLLWRKSLASPDRQGGEQPRRG